MSALRLTAPLDASGSDYHETDSVPLSGMLSRTIRSTSGRRVSFTSTTGGRQRPTTPLARTSTNTTISAQNQTRGGYQRIQTKLLEKQVPSPLTPSPPLRGPKERDFGPELHRLLILCRLGFDAVFMERHKVRHFWLQTEPPVLLWATATRNGLKGVVPLDTLLNINPVGEDTLLFTTKDNRSFSIAFSSPRDRDFWHSKLSLIKGLLIE
ncbi:hypothetical protein GMRT_14363 [Giardia muris]|uniref:PH domain-containing protein n=1 Tax=Giardia muris TaxID=5742 RepID=A0A4Z1T6U5_GIAMU|nr:hypothetical protein GMRT_14363 [Giardia muris]|eukprot:TNJ28211.1 hypothetical protein GMRT_14363 [Giardia muris]